MKLLGQPISDARSTRVRSVDALRGLAALSVCVFHFSTAPGAPLKVLAARFLLTSYGWLGVQAFFVISGFVVPLAMHRSGYRVSRFGLFMLKRLVRLDPPYLASVLLVLALNALVPRAANLPAAPRPDVPQLLGHLFYGFSHFLWSFDWLNPVFWTLEIEFQYYVLIALCFPLLFSTSARVTMAALTVMAAASLVNIGVLHWLSVFSFGITLSLWTSGRLTRPQTLAMFGLFCLAAYVSVGVAVTLVAVATATAIAVWKQPAPIFDFFGRISFSLYLVHVPIGGLVLTMAAAGSAGTGVVGGIVVLLLALAVSVAIAQLLWLAVEHPAQILAGRLRYRESPALAARGSLQALAPASALQGRSQVEER